LTIQCKSAPATSACILGWVTIGKASALNAVDCTFVSYSGLLERTMQ